MIVITGSFAANSTIAFRERDDSEGCPVNGAVTLPVG